MKFSMKKVTVLLADGFEEIEGLMVVDLLRRAGIETRTVSIMGQEEIKGAHGIIVKADSLFENTDFSEVKMLVLSDKTANAESMLREWRRIGDRIWGKFNQSDKEKQAWYYRSCRDALQELHDTSVMKCFEKYIGELFG